MEKSALLRYSSSRIIVADRGARDLGGSRPPIHRSPGPLVASIDGASPTRLTRRRQTRTSTASTICGFIMGRAQGVPVVAIDPEAVKQTLGERIRARRRALKISQVELARLIGVAGAQVQKYEAGRDELRVPAMLALCAALAMSPIDLIEDLQPPSLSRTARYAPPKASKPRGAIAPKRSRRASPRSA